MTCKKMFLKRKETKRGRLSDDNAHLKVDS